MSGVQAIAYQEKIWGKTGLVSKHPGFTVHHLVVVPKSFCSVHLHLDRFNAFFVTKGRMTVLLYGPDNEVQIQTVLEPGDYYEVRPRVRHQFSSDTGCEALEIYFPADVDEGDILRFSEGGRSEEADEYRKDP